MGIQVQSAFKDGQGNPLPFVGKQFISFSYGGKNIEEFDLLVVFKSDRLEKGIYAPFNDTTTEQAELDGQMFWASNFRANNLTLNLATDGMTSAQLEEFKRWFQPGIEKELILSEHHNRAILARVAEVPQISLLPFEKKITVKIGDQEMETSTSLYKGEIVLDFVMDDPYWYSKNSVMENLDNDSVKIIFEDGVPHQSMLKTKCLLADGKYFNGSVMVQNTITLDNKDQETDNYLYYCGTAAAKPEISFSVNFSITEQKKVVYQYLNETTNFYLQIGTNRLELGLPSILYSYNQAVDIVRNYSEEASILDLRRTIRDTITNYYTRSYAIALIDYARNNSPKYEITNTSFKNFFLDNIVNFLPTALNYTINSKTGKVTSSGKIKIITNNDLTGKEETIIENAGNMIKSNYLTIEAYELPKNGIITATNCASITTNSLLNNLQINYKYMYL